MPSKNRNLHIICGRDAGLFSLIQQVISNIPWALAEDRIPVVYFNEECAYWVPKGYEGKHTVWEYYFEPVDWDYPADFLSEQVCNRVKKYMSERFSSGGKKTKIGKFVFICDGVWVSSHFGDDRSLRGKTLAIPYKLNDPSGKLRKKASMIISNYIRPRLYIRDKVEKFYEAYLKDEYVIGVHMRGTDAVSNNETRYFRKNSLNYTIYINEIKKLLKKKPQSKIFVATDDEKSLECIKDTFKERVISYDSIRHSRGETAGKGPMGKIMPAYIANNRGIAAKNGEEAVTEYLLLTRCDILIHNGASLARTVLLTMPALEHINANPNNKIVNRLRLFPHIICSEAINKLRGIKKRCQHLYDKFKTFIGQQVQNVQRIRRIKQQRADYEMVAKVRNQKNFLKGLGSHKDDPNLSLILLSFNNKKNIPAIISCLRLTSAEEIIICEDGSVDESLEEWIKYLNQPNDFLIRSNDVHEIRAYDRAIRFARGKYVAILQDDDIPPENDNWIQNPLCLFNLYPNLAIIGGFQGQIFGDTSIKYGVDHTLPFLEPNLRIPFAFVHAVNVGPIFMKRDVYIEIGGFDFGFSNPGESGIIFDYEMCFRAWEKGYEVGLYSSSFIRNIGVQGTIVYGFEERKNNRFANTQTMKQRYWNQLNDLNERVEKLNEILLPRAAYSAHHN